MRTRSANNRRAVHVHRKRPSLRVPDIIGYRRRTPPSAIVPPASSYHPRKHDVYTIPTRAILQRFWIQLSESAVRALSLGVAFITRRSQVYTQCARRISRRDRDRRDERDRLLSSRPLLVEGRRASVENTGTFSKKTEGKIQNKKISHAGERH